MYTNTVFLSLQVSMEANNTRYTKPPVYIYLYMYLCLYMYKQNRVVKNLKSKTIQCIYKQKRVVKKVKIKNYALFSLEHSF